MVSVTVNDLHGHSPTAKLFKCFHQSAVRWQDFNWLSSLCDPLW